MIDWDKELETIFTDPLFADVVAPKKRPSSSDRLIAGFQTICDYYEANGKLPDEVSTPKLYHNLKGILAHEAKIEKCRPFDNFGILPQKDVPPKSECELVTNVLAEEEMLEQILDDPLLSDITSGDALDMFNVPEYMKERMAARKEADYVGKRVPCEDFDRFADGFKEVHTGLKDGKYKLVKFSIKHLQAGRYFVEEGIIGYLAAFEDEAVDRYGIRDGRTRIIYENGSEADIKLKTLTKNLSVTGYSIQDSSEMSDEEFEKRFTLTDKDIESGTVYVLRSKSARPEIVAIKNLYKIGFTITSVESRIANARKEPTYLYADVEVVATWKVYNVKSSTFEALVHKLFAAVRLQVTVDGYRPQEWFVVPFHVIEEAINAIISGECIEYDPKFQQIIYK